MFIAIIGASQCSAKEANLAEEVGRILAQKGVTLVCGGLGGVMEAACRGASQSGGLTIGILPGGNAGEANPFVKVPIATNMGQARNAIVVRSAQAVIAIGGGYGTLSEIGHALHVGLPIIGLHTWTISRRGRVEKGIIPVSTPQEAVEMALKLARAGSNREAKR